MSHTRHYGCCTSCGTSDPCHSRKSCCRDHVRMVEVLSDAVDSCAREDIRKLAEAIETVRGRTESKDWYRDKITCVLTDKCQNIEIVQCLCQAMVDDPTCKDLISAILTENCGTDDFIQCICDGLQGSEACMDALAELVKGKLDPVADAFTDSIDVVGEVLVTDAGCGDGFGKADATALAKAVAAGVADSTSACPRLVGLEQREEEMDGCGTVTRECLVELADGLALSKIVAGSLPSPGDGPIQMVGLQNSTTSVETDCGDAEIQARCLVGVSCEDIPQGDAVSFIGCDGDGNFVMARVSAGVEQATPQEPESSVGPMATIG